MKRIKRVLSKICLYLGLLSYPLSSAHAGYAVFGVKNDFPMSDGQKVYRDIYVNLGSGQGVKVGTKLDVYRTVNSTDLLNQKTGPNIRFLVAKLKVIHAEDDSAVARILEFSPAESIPNPGYTQVMVGDAVEVSRK